MQKILTFCVILGTLVTLTFVLDALTVSWGLVPQEKVLQCEQQARQRTECIHWTARYRWDSCRCTTRGEGVLYFNRANPHDN